MATRHTITIKQLMLAFGVSAMTVHSWRKGSVTRDPLPATKTNGYVAFSVAEIKKWAKTYGVAIMVDPASLVGIVFTKPGPKPKIGFPMPATKTQRKVKVASA